MKRLNVILPDDVHRRFKLVCVGQDTDMSKVILTLIEEYTKKAEKRKKH